MNSQPIEPASILRWQELPAETRVALSGKLAGLWDAANDEIAFNALSLDKQQALLLLLQRLISKDLWQSVKRIRNVYGSGGVGVDFEAWPFLETALSRRKDFTRRFAKRTSVNGGFYETGRRNAVLHLMFRDGRTRRWHVHFDLYSPVFSVGTFLRHLRHEYFGKLRPDWRLIQKYFD